MTRDGKRVYYAMYYDGEGRQQNMELSAETIEQMYNAEFISLVNVNANRYMSVPVGDATKGTTSPPSHLETTVKSFYQQADRDYCLSYSFANALKYCQFDDAAHAIASYDDFFSFLPLDWSLDFLQNMMLSLAPSIGRATQFNRKQKQKMTVKELLNKPTPYPTLVIPVGRNGYCSHCICVVDDLIFDAMTPFALKLNEESLFWIFGIKVERLHIVYRFIRRSSKRCSKYNREIVYHR